VTPGESHLKSQLRQGIITKIACVKSENYRPSNLSKDMRRPGRTICKHVLL